MRKVAVVTGNRAEYGLLKNTLKEINNSKILELQLIVTGTHLCEEFGYTVSEIESDGFEIEEKIPILMKGSGADCIPKEMGLLMIQLSQVFARISPDILLILGDRYEIFAAVSVAMVMNIPIAHISGGEITEGTIDEQIRHSITKIAHIHFPGAQKYADNIVKMGEESWRVHNVGDPGIENIKLTNLLSKDELKSNFNIEVDENTLLVTYHPVTLEIDDLPYQIDNLIMALNKINKNTIITYPNSDSGSNYIILRLKKFSEENKKVHLYKSLGIVKYLSVMNLCGAVVGNSSSAFVEAPFLKKAAVNIGNRQEGRLSADNIINCSYDSEEIVEAINKSLSCKFRDNLKYTKSLYGEGNTSIEIVKVLETIDINDRLLKKKLIWRC